MLDWFQEVTCNVYVVLFVIMMVLRLDFLMALKLHKVPAYPSCQMGKNVWERNTEADIRQTCVLSFPSLLSADNSAIDTLASSASLQPLCLAKLVSGSFLFCRCLVCQLLPGLCSLILCLTIESEILPFIIQYLINSNRQCHYKLMRCNKERMHMQKEPTQLKGQAESYDGQQVLTCCHSKWPLP